MQTSYQLLDLASVALACRDRETLLKTFAARTGSLFSARAVLVWLQNPLTQELVCHASWSASGSRIALGTTNCAGKRGILYQVYESGEAKCLDSEALASAELRHLEDSFREHVTSALYSPLRRIDGAIGIVEVLRNSAGFTEADACFLEEASCLIAQAMKNLDDLGEERQTQLVTLERLTTLFDLGRTFTSSLELAELLPVVANKIRDAVEAGACNLWLGEARSGELYLAQKAGDDPSTEEGARVSSSAGLLAEVVQRAAPKLLEGRQAEAEFKERLKVAGHLEVRSWMGAPLRKGDEVLGVVEVLNLQDGEPFTEDDLFFLASISEQAATCLHNAKLLESERRVSALDALLKISQEITSTLDLDHVLATVVNQARTIVSFDRFVIGYVNRGRFVLGAVSGEQEVAQTAEMKALGNRLEWVAQQKNPVSAELYQDGWHVEPEAAREHCVPFLEANQYNGFYAIPLHDDQGPIGAMALLNANADFLPATSRDILAILANQTTVAIRNSQLYQQLPFAGLLQPLAQRKLRRQSQMRKRIWVHYTKRIAAVLAVFVIMPWPLRVGTDATVVPAERRIVSSIEGGVIERVFVKEGDTVRSGDALAQLNDGEDRIKLAQAQAALESAWRELGEAEFRNDPSAAGQAKIRADLHVAEVQLEQKRIADARMRSPIAGVVVTPKVEEKVGTMLKRGEGFAEIVDQQRMAAELSVAETDLAIVRPGRNVALKLNAFPTRTFQGTIERVGSQARSESNEQFFIVRATFANPGGLVKDGMAGRARIRAGGGEFHSGWYPVGYVLLRAPLRWSWAKLWALFP